MPARSGGWALWVPALPSGAAVQPLAKHKPQVCWLRLTGRVPENEGGPAAWSPRRASARHLSLAALVAYTFCPVMGALRTGRQHPLISAMRAVLCVLLVKGGMEETRRYLRQRRDPSLPGV